MTQNRLLSLDIFRGATVAFMILVNNPGSWEYVFAPLRHAQWNGCTPTDLVFPFFLFAVGNSMAFSLSPSLLKNSQLFWKKTIKRTFIIFMIGLFLNWTPFFHLENNSLQFNEWKNVRILGVLQRIALCYFLASIIIKISPNIKLLLFRAFTLLIGYWLITATYKSGNPFSITGYLGTDLDLFLFGENHLYHGEGIAFDPEGILSTFSASFNVIFGYVIGVKLKNSKDDYKTLSQLLLWGSGLILLGFLCDYIFPINKKIWSSSYALLTTGFATICLLILVYLLEFKKNRNPAFNILDYFGKNPLFIYFLSGLIPDINGIILWKNENTISPHNYFTPLNWLSFQLNQIFSPYYKFSSLLYALILLCFFALVAYLLNKKKIYIKV